MVKTMVIMIMVLIRITAMIMMMMMNKRVIAILIKTLAMTTAAWNIRGL